MDGWQWRAWVGPPGGGKVGAAFLVTADRLLTCAHSVRGLDEARIGFPGLREDLPARVTHVGGWRRAGDLGDVAVLELREPVPYAPARLAAPDDPRVAGRTFGVWGFPRRHDRNERHATVTTSPHRGMRQEWWELKTGPGDWLEEGYSGSAVYDTDTGEVIGMVTNAELRHGDRADLGWMLPLASLRAHWEPLDDLLPLRWASPDARRELRELLDGVRFTEPLAADLAWTVGRPALDGFRSAWASVRYVAEGLAEERLVRYLAALGRHLPEARRQRLTAWSARHLPGAAPAPAHSDPASVIVRLERVTFDNAFDVAVQTWIDGAEGPSRPVARVPERKVREVVEEGVAAVAPALFGRDWMIEFAVPESWLGRPFEQWYVDARNRIPMRRYPVVVRDVERLRPGSIRRDQAHHRWRLLTERGCGEPHRVACDAPRRGGDFERWLEAHVDFSVLVYGSRPMKTWLKAALNNGIPVMLWTREKCVGPSHDDCEGHRVLDDLTAAVGGRSPAELPRIALALRKEALVAPDGEPHCGRALTLLWDDPSRLPDPPLAMEV
ncbi:trypsin-like peptidase domain-containing protein [Actinomadura decatromicini]|uniref:Trypsin-like peptidase domain-containing protein n=1 Tax=Actinomadura decatromicini TaxID=2604572 RepID=A0A5D3FM64_9ACTN|nr:trypsin-like peptidase domain-containing protein [Actinomadura decatromicini]TYK49224.1 trypsin-like peptidase domain-containing protein [Actinomadura decatromicini]